MKRNIALTKNGMPALWECGGAMTNSANCVIIGDKNGNRKKPVFIRTSGHLSNDNHALFILNKDDIIVVGTRAHADHTFMILKYVSFEKVNGNGIGEFEVLNHFSEGQWDSELDSKFEAMLDAARLKMKKYHCRDTVYALGLNIVEDTIRDIKEGKFPKLDKNLSTNRDIINAYFKANVGKEKEVIKQLDFSEFTLDDVAKVVRYVPWQCIRTKLHPNIIFRYETHRNTNYLFHFIIAPNTYDEDYLNEMAYNGVSFETAETRDFNSLPDNKKIRLYLGRLVVYVNFIHVPEYDTYCYASSDALHFTMDFGQGRRLCMYEHLSHVVKRPPTIDGVDIRIDKEYNATTNLYSASCLIEKNEK